MKFCDTDKNWSLTYAEASSDYCTGLQQEHFGNVISQDDFNAIDANNDGEINVEEVMAVAQEYFM